MANASLERLIALVRRELGAESVRVLETEDGEAEAENVLYARLPDGRHLAVAFASAPASKPALVRRLEMLTATFAQSLEPPSRRPPARPSPGRSLQEELRALAVRARAADAAVIDTHSPVVWGAASAEPDGAAHESVPMVDVSRARLSDALGDANESGEDDAEAEVGATARGAPIARELRERAIGAARGLPGLATLRKGGHVGHTVRDADLGVFVRSFASIYLIVLAYDGAFDEIRAERAVEDALPRVERLVLALPPLDPKPAPIAGVVALRRARRR